MRVNGNDYQLNIYPTLINRAQGKSDTSVFTIDNSDTGSKDSSINIWTELGNKYDIRHATFEELCEISSKLYSSGQISLGEHAILTFDWKRAADDFRTKYPETVSDLNLIKADSEGRRDWIAEFDARAKRDFSIGNITAYELNKKLARLLEQIKKEKS